MPQVPSVQHSQTFGTVRLPKEEKCRSATVSSTVLKCMSQKKCCSFVEVVWTALLARPCDWGVQASSGFQLQTWEDESDCFIFFLSISKKYHEHIRYEHARHFASIWRNHFFREYSVQGVLHDWLFGLQKPSPTSLCTFLLCLLLQHGNMSRRNLAQDPYTMVPRAVKQRGNSKLLKLSLQMRYRLYQYILTYPNTDPSILCVLYA